MYSELPLKGIASMVLVAIDEIGGETHISGRIFNEYMEESLSFDNLAELLFKVDGLLDSLCFPQSSVRVRGKASVPTLQDIRNNPPRRFDRPKVFAGGKAAGLTLVLNVVCRQHASWQGYLYKAGKGSNKREHFRSAMEALYLVSLISRQHGGRKSPRTAAELAAIG